MNEPQLPVPVSPEDFLKKIIDPALAMLPAKMTSRNARIAMLVIAMQESALMHRRQLVGNPPTPTGPAKSFWQAEQGGGLVHGVRLFTRGGVNLLAEDLYHQRGLFNKPMQITSMDRVIWDAIEHDDILAAGLARLLLWTHAAALPDYGEVLNAWNYYLELWRPGAYTRGNQQVRDDLWRKWKTNYGIASNAVWRAYP